MRRGLAILWLCAGCDSVFGLTRPDAAIVHDEDGDHVDDSIDVCPGDADDQLDTDHDGVGDACDPHPDFPIDRLRYFSSLRDFAGWQIVTGSWLPVGDGVRQVDQAPTDSFAVLDLGVLTEPTIEVTIEDPGGSTSHDSGVNVYPVTTDQTGMACAEVEPGPTAKLIDNRHPPTLETPSASLEVGDSPIRVILRPTSGSGGPPQCIVQMAGASATTLMPMDTAPITTARVGLYTYNGIATFLSVTVIDRL